MAEYIKRDDAIKTYCDGCPLYVKCVSDGIECSKMQMFKRIPAADVVEVVTCNCCKHYDKTTNNCDLYGVKHWAGFFCGDAEVEQEG